MNKKFFITILIFISIFTLTDFNPKANAQQNNELLISPQTSSLTISDSTETPSIPTINPTIDIVSPNVKNVEDADLKQSLSINEIKGKTICKNIDNCPKNNEDSEIEVNLKSAVVTGIANNVLSVKIFDLNYNVDVSNAKILRAQWIGSNLNDFSTGDIVNIYGFLDKDNPHLINAQTVRNISIYKNLIIFNGLISNLSNNTFVLKTETNNTINVIINNETKIIRVEPATCIMIYPPADCPKSISTIINFTDLREDERAIVRGNWEKNSIEFVADQIIVGNDGREFFNKILNIPQVFKSEEQDNLNNKIKNQIKNLQEQIKKIKEQLKV